ncbi:MAG: hypothetical protein ACR2PG_15330 [Hyphomicrobiaceae bacterium]
MEPDNEASWHGSIRIRVGAGARQAQLVDRLRAAGATSVHAGRFGIDAEVDVRIVREALGLDVRLAAGQVSLVPEDSSTESVVKPSEAYVPSRPDYF